MFEAARGQEGVAEVWQRGEDLRLEGYRRLIGILAQKRPLRQPYDVAAAADVLFVLLGPDTYRAFTEGRRWPTDRWRSWAAAALERELFGSSR